MTHSKKERWMNDECYLMHEAQYKRERETKWLSSPMPLSLLLPAASVEPTSSKWNHRAAWSTLALKGMKTKTTTGQHDPTRLTVG